MTQIDKKGWKKVRFGDVCRNLNVTVKNPSEQGYNRVVGLENIESGNLHISSWGDVSDGTTFTKTFELGHVLFGKRRAYLKKAAYAEFKGLCSGDILVFEANEMLLNSKLLPFIVSSDRFFDHAVKTSAGSLSPRTKFQDLASFEFLLPPIDKQEKLAELLWASDFLIERKLDLRTNLNNALWSFVNSEISKIDSFEVLSNLGNFQKGKGISKADVRSSGIPAIRYGEIYTTHHVIYEKPCSFIEESYRSKTVRLKYGDVLFAGSGETIEDIGKAVAIVEENEVYAGGDIIVFRPYGVTFPYFWGYLFNSAKMRNKISRLGKGAQVVHVYASDLAALRVPITDVLIQKELGEKFKQFRERIADVDNELTFLKGILENLRNDIFRLTSVALT